MNAVDFRGVNPLNQLIKGERLLTANAQILEYLIKAGCNLNTRYEEDTYAL